MSIVNAARQLLPPFLFAFAKKIYSWKVGFSGSYADYDQALLASSGYDNSHVADKALLTLREQIKSLPGTPTSERTQQLLSSIAIAGLDMGCTPTSILDFGGGGGYYYFDIERLVPGRLKNWVVVETPSMVKSMKTIEDDVIRFTDSFPRPGTARYDLVLASGSIQYCRAPYTELQHCLRLGKYICLNRVPVIDGFADRLTVQTVPKSIYKNTSFPAWFLSHERLMKEIHDIGGEILSYWDVPQDAPLLDGKTIIYRGYLIKSHDPDTATYPPA